MNRCWLRKHPNDNYCTFLSKLTFQGVIEKEDYHREMGKASGYPKCCIDNFIKLDKQGVEKIACFMDNKFGKDKSDVHYVRCEKCRGCKE